MRACPSANAIRPVRTKPVCYCDSAAALFAGNEDESDIRGVSVMAVTYQTLIVGDVPRGWS